MKLCFLAYLWLAWTRWWTKGRSAGDLRRHAAHVTSLSCDMGAIYVIWKMVEDKPIYDDHQCIHNIACSPHFRGKYNTISFQDQSRWADMMDAFCFMIIDRSMRSTSLQMRDWATQWLTYNAMLVWLMSVYKIWGWPRVTRLHGTGIYDKGFFYSYPSLAWYMMTTQLAPFHTRHFQIHYCLNTFRPEQNNRHFIDEILKCIFFKKMFES